MPHAMSPERAEILGLEALSWLVGDSEALDKFLSASGVSGDELRDAAGSPELTVAILDFLLAHEPILLAFCDANAQDSQSVHRARQTLQPDTGSS